MLQQAPQENSLTNPALALFASMVGNLKDDGAGNFFFSSRQKFWKHQRAEPQEPFSAT